MPKALREKISLGGGFIVAGILESIGINDNEIISGLFNFIHSPSNLRYLVKKSHEATFMMISGFVCNYPCSMSCNKGEHAGIGHLFKEIAFCDGDRVQSMRIEEDSYKGISEEVAKALDVSLK